MGLADALAAEMARGHAKRCYVCTMLDTLPPEDAKALVAALGDKRLSNVAITRALNSEGHTVYQHSVGRHRRRECLQT